MYMYNIIMMNEGICIQHNMECIVYKYMYIMVTNVRTGMLWWRLTMLTVCYSPVDLHEALFNRRFASSMAITICRHSSSGSKDHSAKTLRLIASILNLSSWPLLWETDTLQVAHSLAENSARQSCTPKFFLKQLCRRMIAQKSVGMSLLLTNWTELSGGSPLFADF